MQPPISTTKLSCQKHLFTIPPHVSYINCAYMGPILKSAEQIGIENVRRKSSPWEISADDFFNEVEVLKTKFSKLIHCSEPQRIAIIPSVSYGIANAATNVPMQPGQHILMAAEQFPSNYYIWERVAKEKGGEIKMVTPPTELKDRAKNWNQSILNNITKDTAAVAIGNIHWADGSLFDLMAIREATRAVGAYLIVDGSQTIGILPTDISKLQPDALITVGYKWMLGAYGTGLAYYGPAYDEGTPIEESWMNRLNSEDFQNLVNYQPLYKPKANKYNVGEISQFIHVAMLNRSIDQLLEWGLENMQTYCRELTAEPVAQLRSLGCHIESAEYRCEHLIGIHLPKHIVIDDMKRKLKERNVQLSFRGTAIRIAPNVYNDATDFERLLDAFS